MTAITEVITMTAKRSQLVQNPASSSGVTIGIAVRRVSVFAKAACLPSAADALAHEDIGVVGRSEGQALKRRPSRTC